MSDVLRGVPQIAAFLGGEISPTTVNTRLISGEIPGWKVGYFWYAKKEDLSAYMAATPDYGKRRKRAFRSGSYLEWPSDIAKRVVDLRNQRKTWSQIAHTFGVCAEVMRSKARSLGIDTNPDSRYVVWRKYSESDDAYLRTAWLEHIDLNTIAMTLGRSPEAIRMRMFNKHRDILSERGPSEMRIVKAFGKGCLPLGDSVSKVRKVVKRADAKRHAIWVASRVKQMKSDIRSGRDRRKSILDARADGLTLEAIGNALGLTRERVRQICARTPKRLSAERRAELALHASRCDASAP